MVLYFVLAVVLAVMVWIFFLELRLIPIEQFLLKPLRWRKY